MRDPQTKTIGEHSVTASVLPPRDALQVQVTLVKLLGPGLFAAFKSGGGSKEELGGMLMSALSSNVDEATVTKLIEKLLGFARVDGAKVSLDSADVFGGDPLLVWETALHVLVSNFADFTNAVRSRFGQVAKKAQASNQSNSPT